MPQDHWPQIDDDAKQSASRDPATSKAKTARVTDAVTRRDSGVPSRKNGKQPHYEKWTREALYAHARDIGIQRRSSMSKAQLIEALRSH